MFNYSDLLRKGDLIEERLHILGDVSHTDGVPGVWRAVHTETDFKAKKIIKEWFEEAGLEVHEDAFGNIFGRFEGQVKETILVGSHVDTVKDGGLYDGACGVISALTAVQQLKDAGWKPYYSIEVVGTEEEEGSRFDLSYPGSNVIIGGLKDHELDVKDETGKVLRDVMEENGYDWMKIPEADRRKDVIAYVELHVEQGEVLEREKLSVGVVENITGMVNIEATIYGEQNHAGATPMYMRKDPMVKTAEIITEATAKVKGISSTGVVTFGELSLHPCVANVIPGSVHFIIDLRDGNGQALLKEEEEVMRIIKAAADEGFRVDVNMYNHEDPVPLDGKLVDALEEAVKESGISYKRMNSGAGHDAMIIGREIPTCMIFIPSANGISHSPLEYTSAEDVGKGCEVLGRLLVKLGK